MGSPIKIHRPKCALRGRSFATHMPWISGCTCFEFLDGTQPSIIMDVVDLNRGLIVVEVEWRDYMDDWFIYAKTTAPDWQRLASATETPNRKFYVANNATQVRDYVREHPHRFPPDGPASAYDPQRFVAAMHKIMDETYAQAMQSALTEQETEMPTATTQNRADAIRRQAAELLIEADRLDQFPREPKGPIYRKAKRRKGRVTVPEVRADVIWWEMRFDARTGNPRTYTYAATRTRDGLWNTTGPQSPKAYTWDQLINWIYENMDEPEIFVVTDMERI